MSNNLIGHLHTSALGDNRHKAYNKPEFYSFLRIPENFENTIILNNIDSQITALKKREIEFYNTIFPGRKITTYEKFHSELLRIILQQDVKAFKIFSNYSHNNQTLYQYLKSNLMWSDTHKGNLGQNITNNKLIQGENGNILSARELITNNSELTFSLQEFKRKGNSGKINVNIKNTNNKVTGRKMEFDVYKTIKESPQYREMLEEMTLETLSTQFLPDLIETLQSQRRQLIKEQKLKGILPENYKVGDLTEPQVAYALYPFIRNQFRKALRQQFGNANFSEAELDFFYSWTIAKSEQIKIIQGGKNKTRKGFYSNLEALREGLLSMIKATGASQNFINAFNLAWAYKDNALEQATVESLRTNNTNMVAGILGEMAGLILIYYLRQQGLAVQWTGEKYVDEIIQGKEQSRADLLVETFGIQVKNYKKSTLKWGADVNLHPAQVVALLTKTIGVEQALGLETIFANLIFNKDFSDEIEGILYKFLPNYLGILSNFDFNEETKDTSGFWLIGGTMLVPGSALLTALRKQLEDILIKHENINKILTIDYNKPEIGDEYYNYNYELTKSGRYAPSFVKYWIHNKGGWKTTEEEEREYNRLTRTQSTSIRIHLQLDKILEYLNQNYSFLE